MLLFFLKRSFVLHHVCSCKKTKLMIELRLYLSIYILAPRKKRTNTKHLSNNMNNKLQTFFTSHLLRTWLLRKKIIRKRSGSISALQKCTHLIVYFVINQYNYLSDRSNPGMLHRDTILIQPILL